MKSNITLNFIKMNHCYTKLQKATTTAERRTWLKMAMDLMYDYPELYDYYTLNEDSWLLATRIKQIKDCPNFNLDTVPRFKDGIDRETERTFKKVVGLYFLGEVTANPETLELYYWVKIGYSSDLASRARQYDTHCPTTWRIDFCENGELEFYYHKLLGACCIDRATGNEEWFRVDRETYLEMCEKGFAYFD